MATRAGRGDLVTVDPESGEVAVVVEGGTWSSPGWADTETIVAGLESHRLAPSIVTVTLGGTVTALVETTPAEVRSAPHVRPETVTFASGDGLEIPAFLFRPPAADRGRVPAVVYPHGGPTRCTGTSGTGSRPILHRQGICLAGGELPRVNLLRP